MSLKVYSHETGSAKGSLLGGRCRQSSYFMCYRQVKPIRFDAGWKKREAPLQCLVQVAFYGLCRSRKRWVREDLTKR